MSTPHKPVTVPGLWYEKTSDMQALVEPEYNALCYLLDGKGKRVSRMDDPL